MKTRLTISAIFICISAFVAVPYTHAACAYPKCASNADCTTKVGEGCWIPPNSVFLCPGECAPGAGGITSIPSTSGTIPDNYVRNGGACYRSAQCASGYCNDGGACANKPSGTSAKTQTTGVDTSKTQTTGVDTTTGKNVTLINPLGAGTNLETLLNQVLSFVVRIGAIIVIFMLVYVGFLFVTARGEPGKITTARQALLWTIIGALILLGAQVISIGIQATVQALSAGTSDASSSVFGSSTFGTPTFTGVGTNGVTSGSLGGVVTAAKQAVAKATSAAGGQAKATTKKPDSSLVCEPDPDGVTYTKQGSDCIPNNGGCAPNKTTDGSGEYCVSPEEACPSEDGVSFTPSGGECIPNNGGCESGYTAVGEDCVTATGSDYTASPDENGNVDNQNTYEASPDENGNVDNQNTYEAPPSDSGTNDANGIDYGN